MKQTVDHAKEQGHAALEEGHAALEEGTIRELEARFDSLILDGYAANPKAKRSQKQGAETQKRGREKQTKGRNLLARLHQKNETLAFLHDFSVPFDNNLAERDIRMMKVRQKISGCFRTQEGADTFALIRGYLSTLRKQGHNVLNSLISVFQNKPTIPAF